MGKIPEHICGTLCTRHQINAQSQVCKRRCVRISAHDVGTRQRTRARMKCVCGRIAHIQRVYFLCHAFFSAASQIQLCAINHMRGAMLRNCASMCPKRARGAREMRRSSSRYSDANDNS